MTSNQAPHRPRSSSTGPRPSDDTLAAGGVYPPEPVTRSILPPVFQTATYVHEVLGDDPEFTYSRSGNPTVSELERALAAFEGLPHGRAFATGMAAITTLFLATVERGGHVVCSDVVYGGTIRLLERILVPLGIEVTYVDSSQTEAVARALRPETRLVFIETPANPTLKLTDVGAVAEVLDGHSALLAVDNTFLTAALQRPAALGADVVVYSTTKYIEGHNSTLGGALLLRDEDRLERLDLVRKTTGSIQAPWDAWLTLKGLKTLALRMERHSESALRIASWLGDRPEVREVFHPFHPSFPQRDLAQRQQAAGGGMIAFELAGGVEAVRELFSGLTLCRVAENLGATESLLTHPASMSHSDVDPDAKRATGVTEGLVRLSVGLEAPGDLIEDLARALAAIPKGVTA